MTTKLHSVQHKAAVAEPEVHPGINLTTPPSGKGCKECLASGMAGGCTLTAVPSVVM